VIFTVAWPRESTFLISAFILSVTVWNSRGLQVRLGRVKMVKKWRFYTNALLYLGNDRR